jgi:CBS domain-containing protein
MKVHELMSRDVKTCRASDDLNRAAQVMWEGDLGVVPVVDDEGRPHGIITDRDLCMAAYIKGATLRSLHVSDAMNKPVAACSLDASIETAMTMMREARVRRLPVVDASGKLVGLLSLNDLAREASRQRRSPGRQISVEVADTLGAISHPRRPVVAMKSELRRLPDLAAATA